MNSVRGYPEGDYMADTGGIINADWFLPFYLIPENWVLPGQTQALRNQVMPIVFMDYGAGHLKRVNPGEAHDKTLMGMGGGLRMRFGKSVMVRLEWAKDMKNKPVSGSGPSTFYLHCQAEF
jgi:hemolysin activation/secretion protein